MSWDLHFVVDEAAIAWVRDLFREAEKRRGRLDHAMRLILDPDEGPGLHLSKGWAEFTDAPGLAFAAYRRPGGVQQLCFIGEEARCEEYTNLAQLAADRIPMRWNSIEPLAGETHPWRDLWTLTLYQLAFRAGCGFGLDLEGPRQFQTKETSPWLGNLAANFDQDVGPERDSIQRWQADRSRRNQRVARYAYASLNKGLFSCSVLATEYLLNHLDMLHGLSRISYGDAAGRVGPSEVVSTFSQGEADSAVVQSANDARDTWMDRLHTEGRSFQQIYLELKGMAPSKRWVPLGSGHAVRAALKRYRTRKNMPPLRRRRSS